MLLPQVVCVLWLAGVPQPLRYEEVGRIRLPLPRSAAGRIAVLEGQDGQHEVYIAAGSGGLHVVNATVDEVPTVTETLLQREWATDVVAAGEAIVAAAGSGDFLRVVTGGDERTVTGVTGTGRGGNRKVAASGATVFTGLEVVNVTAPHAPNLIRVAGGFQPSAVAADGTGLGYALSFRGFTTFRLQPSAEEVGTLSTRGGDSVAAVHHSHAYVVNAVVGELYVVDCTDPAAPRMVRTTRIPGATGVRFAGRHAWVLVDGGTSAPHHVAVLDVSVPGTPQTVDKVYTPRPPKDVQVAGDVLYITVRDLLLVHRLRDAGRAARVPLQEDPSVVVGTDDGYAFVGGRRGQVTLVDVRYPAAPATVWTHDAGSTRYRAAAVVGRLVYASTGFGIEVWDVSDPAAPVLAGEIDTVFTTVALAASEELLVACSTSSVSVYDVRGPVAAAERVGRSATRWRSELEAVAVVGDVVYAVGAELVVLNASSPSVPLLGTVPMPGIVKGSSSIAVDAGYVYVAAGADGLHVVDVSNSSSPRVAGTARTPYPASSVTVAAGYAVAAAGRHLLFVSVANPTRPAVAAQRMLEGTASSLAAVQGGTRVAAAVVSPDSLLAVSEFGAPGWRPPPEQQERQTTTMNIVGTLQGVAGRGNGVAVGDEGRAFVAGSNGLAVVGMQDVHRPTLLHTLMGGTRVSAVAAAHGVVTFVARRTLWVADAADPSSVKPVHTALSASLITSLAVLLLQQGGGEPAVFTGAEIVVLRTNETSLVAAAPAGGRPHAMSVWDGDGGRRMVAAVGSDGFHVVDVAASATVGSIRGLRGAAVAVSGGFAYVGGADSRKLHVVSLADPHAPALVYTSPERDVASVVVPAGPYGLLTIGTAQRDVSLLRTGDDAAPRGIAARLHTLPVAARTHLAGATPDGSYACLLDSQGTLSVVDLRSRFSMESVRPVDDDDDDKRVCGAEGSGEFAYAASRDGKLSVFSLALHGAPRTVGHVADGASTRPDGLVVTGPLVVTYRARDVKVVSTAAPLAPVLQQQLRLPSIPRSMAADGDVVVAAGMEFHVMRRQANNNTLSDPVGIPRAATPWGLVSAVAVAGDLAVAAADRATLFVVNVSSALSEPVVAGHVAAPNGVSGVAVSGKRAYAVHPAGLTVVDIGDPSRPEVVSTVDVPGAVQAAVTGSLVVLTSRTAVHFVNATNSHAPFIAGTQPLPSADGTVQAMHAQGSAACVVQGTKALHFFRLPVVEGETTPAPAPSTTPSPSSAPDTMAPSSTDSPLPPSTATPPSLSPVITGAPSLSPVITGAPSLSPVPPATLTPFAATVEVSIVFDTSLSSAALVRRIPVLQQTVQELLRAVLVRVRRICSGECLDDEDSEQQQRMGETLDTTRRMFKLQVSVDEDSVQEGQMRNVLLNSAQEVAAAISPDTTVVSVAVKEAVPAGNTAAPDMRREGRSSNKDDIAIGLGIGGGVLLLCLVAAAVFFCCRRDNHNNNNNNNNNDHPRAPDSEL